MRWKQVISVFLFGGYFIMNVGFTGLFIERVIGALMAYVRMVFRATDDHAGDDIEASRIAEFENYKAMVRKAFAIVFKIPVDEIEVSSEEDHFLCVYQGDNPLAGCAWLNEDDNFVTIRLQGKPDPNTGRREIVGRYIVSGITNVTPTWRRIF